MEPLKYLETYESKNTVDVYKHVLKVFLSNIYGKGDLAKLAIRYFKEKRDYESDIQNFFARINGRPPTTVRLYISAVRTFLIENKIDVPQIFWRRLNRRIKGSMAATQDKIPSNVELRRIVTHMPVHGKALYLSLASSGMRIGECLKLQLNDIDLTKDPAEISIRREYTKSGNPRRAFISSEAKEYIQEWLRNRNQYLELASKRSSRHEKSTEDSRLFPFNLSTAHVIWINALDKSELNHKDNSTNRYKIHPHVLRKFFRTRMGSVIPVDVTEALMGHKGYLTDVYRRYSVEDLAKFYKQGEEAVLIFGKVEETIEIRQDVKKLESRIVDLNRKIEEQKGIIDDLSKLMNEKIGEVTAKIQEEHFRKIFEENYGITIKELQEFCRQMRKKKQISSEP